MAFVSHQENKHFSDLRSSAYINYGFNFLDDQHTIFMVMSLVALCSF